MKEERKILLNVVILVIAFGMAGVGWAAPMGTAFTYQGRLTDANSPADGLYDFEFEVYDDPDGGSQQGSTVDVNDVDVVDGSFALKLDFGADVFTGDARWLQIGVRPGASSDPCDFTTLSPRQELTPTPYALYAKSSGDAVDGHSLDAADGSPADALYVDTEGHVGIGTTNPGNWKLQVIGGNFGLGIYADGLIRATLFQDNANVNYKLDPANTGTSLAVAGSVGIGTTSPGEKLEVAGNIKVSGAGKGVIFPDGTKQITALSGGGVPSGFSILGDTPAAPPGYTLTGALSTSFWVARADMPTARQNLAAAAVNGKVYAIGGYDGSSYLARNEEYDPATNTWVIKADMLTARHNLAAAAVNGKIYAIGGYGGSSYLTKNEEYDPVTNSWSARMDMPTARQGLAAAVVNGRIYTVGGWPSSEATKNEEYDAAANTWVAKADMPTGRWNLAAAAVNGKVYAIGGDGDRDANEEYDPATNSWATKTDMPTYRLNHAAVAVNGRIYVIGGMSARNLATNEEYDHATDTWTTRVDMPTARNGLAAAAANGMVFAIGGHDGAFSAKNEEYILDQTYYIHRKN